MDWNKFHLPYREDTAFSLLAFCVFIVPLAFSLVSYENFESIKFALFLILTGASAAVFFWRLDKGKAVFKYNRPFIYLLGAFFGWAVVSSIFSLDSLYSLFGFYYRYTSGLVFYAVLLVFVGLLLSLLNSAKLEFLFKILVVDALAVSLVAFLQSFGWIFYEGLDQDSLFRGPSLLGNINYSAMFLACVLPLAVYFFFHSRSLAAKMYYFIAIFFIIFGSLILSSRGALLAIGVSGGVAMILLLLFKFPKKLFLVLLAAVILTCLGGYAVLRVGRPQAVSAIVSSADGNTTDRLYAWDLSFKAIALRPLLGSGPGNYELVFERMRTGINANQVGIFDDAHNIFLNLAVTGGLPLALIFTALLLLVTFSGLKQLKKTKNLFYVALLSSLAGWAIAACFNPVPIPLYMLLAVLWVGLLDFNEEKEFNIAAWQKVSGIILGSAIFIFGSLNLVSEHFLGFAKIAYGQGHYRAAYNFGLMSYDLNPTNQLGLYYKISSEINFSPDRRAIEADIHKAALIHPLQTDTDSNISNFQAMLYDHGHNAEDLQSAIDYMQAALKIDPSFADRYGQLAVYYYQMGNYSQAQANAEREVVLDNTSFSAFILLAKLYQLRGEKEQTVAMLTKAFQINPDSAELKYVLYWAKTLPDIRKVPFPVSTAPAGI